MSNIEVAQERCEYACKLLEQAKIPYQVKNSEIGHINLYCDLKVVMSFWARTGKIIFTCSVEDIKHRLKEDDRGIKKLIKVYHANFGK